MIRVLFTIGAIQLLQMVVLLARTKGLALLLGPEQVGVLAVIDKLIAVFVQAASLSLPFAALRFLPSLWVSDRQEFSRRLRGMSRAFCRVGSPVRDCLPLWTLDSIYSGGW